MNQKRKTIEVHPGKRSFLAPPGKTLYEVFREHGLPLRSDCGGKGTCGKCKIIEISASGARKSCLSCTLVVAGNLKVEIPKASISGADIISKVPISFPPSYSKRLIRGSEQKGIGAAVDLGTTTIAVYLFDRSKDKVISAFAMQNPQTIYGYDVMSRIGAIEEDKKNLEYMQRLVVNAIEFGIFELLDTKSLQQRDITKIIVVGNPAMIHILSGIDPRPIGISPHMPVIYEERTIESGCIGFELGNIPLRTLPQISGFIGGDIISSALATDLENQPEGTMLIDLGTNGELLFKAKDKLFATSCATGPAFEGASLSCGMQAIPGAIDKVLINNIKDFAVYTTINSKKRVHPTGICGTGVISTVAELLRNRIIGPSGSFVSDTTIKPLQKDSAGRPQYTLVAENKVKETASVFISQKDIRSVQLGKAALITGIEFLTKAAGYNRPNKIIIAGAFGSRIEKTDMLTTGMIPDLGLDKIEYAGNSAGTGALMMLNNYYFREAVDMAEKITSIDLATNVSFQEAFVGNLGFPEPSS